MLTAILLLLLAVVTACAGGESGGGDGGAANSGNGTGGGVGVAQVDSTETPIPTAPAVARPTYVVQRGTVQEVLEFTGRWQPRDQVTLAFEVAGSVRQVNVRTGDTVTAGQLLADLDVGELENQLENERLSLETARSNLESGSDSTVQSVENAEIALANARLDLERTRTGNPWPSVARARASLDNAEQDVEEAERAYEEALSRPQEPNSSQSVDQAWNNLVAARERLRDAEISYYDAAQSYQQYQFTIATAENNVLQREIDLERARTGATAGDDANALQAVRSSELRIEQLQEQIRQSSLFSPIDGVVLEVTIQPGDQVQAFDTVITVGVPEPREIIANLPFGDAQQLNRGDVGVCEIFNRPETAVQCVVRRVPLTAREVDQTTRVAATLDAEPNAQILVQMPLETRENVLWLPPVAVRTFQNRFFVVLQTPDGERGADVEVGLQTDDRWEIVSGVQEGDVVVGGP